MPLQRRTGLEPRHGFTTPEQVLAPVDAADRVPASGSALVLGDRRGEAIIDRARIALGWEASALHLHARVASMAPVIHPEREPDDHRFWMQDHIELRLLPDADWDMEQVQVLMTASGRVLVVGGLAPAEVDVRVTIDDASWTLAARIPVALLGRAGLRLGDRIRGLVAHVAWADGAPDIAVSTPAVLGFSHAERFAEMVCGGTSPVVFEGLHLPRGGGLVAGENRGEVRLRAAGSEPVRGRLTLTIDGRPISTDARRVEPGGAVAFPVAFELARPSYRALELRWIGDDDVEHPVASLRLRAAVAPVVPAVALVHPYLEGGAEVWDARLALLDQEPYRSLAAERDEIDLAARLAALPDPDAEDAFRFTPSCAGWFRVCRESLLGKGETGDDPVMARIWSMLGPEAQAAARAIVATGGEVGDEIAPLLAAFDGLLERCDLWDVATFDRVHLPKALAALLERCGGAPEPGRELRWFNRSLLQSSIECLGSFRMSLVTEAADIAERYCVDRDRRWIDAATRFLAVAERCVIMPAELHLHTGMLCGKLALCWDVASPAMDPEQRAVWLRWLERLLAFYLTTARADAWTVTAIANANPVGNGGAGRLALALLVERPELAREALAYARTNIWNWVDYCTGSDGSNTEGAQYWQYGFEHFLPFALALERVTGDHDGLLDQSGVVGCMAMVRAGLCPDGAMHGVNDTIPTAIGGAIAWWAGARFADPLAAWYGDHAMAWFARRRAAGKPTPYRSSLMDALRYRPPGPLRSQAPALPGLVVLPQVALVTLRSASRWDCGWIAGLKGSRPPYTHHNQPDTGSVFVHRHGERLLIDPGYYKGAPEHHCLPLIDGRGPVVEGAYVGPLVAHGEHGDLRWACVDATLAYGGLAERARRTVVMVGECGVIVIDDIVPTRVGCEVRCLWQCGGPVRVSPGGVAVVEGKRARIALRALSHPGLVIALEDERRLDDVHWGYTFADCRHFPMAWRYHPSADLPLVTVITDPDQIGRSSIARDADRVEVGLGDRRLALARGIDGWAVVPSPVTVGPVSR